MGETVSHVQPFDGVGSLEEVERNALGISLSDEVAQLLDAAEIVVGATGLGELGLTTELDSFDPLATPVREDEEALAVDGGGGKIEGQGLGPPTPIDDDPHIHGIVGTHGRREDIVELVVSDGAGDFPVVTGASRRRITCSCFGLG